MSTDGSVVIPGERIEPIARETADNSKNIAGVLGFFFVIFTIAAVSMVFDNKRESRTGDSAEHAGELIGSIIGAGLFAGLPGMIALRFARRASRATRAAKAAATDPDVSWRLVGKLVIAERGGVPQPDMSFNVSGRGRAMLVAVPRAAVVK